MPILAKRQMRYWVRNVLMDPRSGIIIEAQWDWKNLFAHNV